MVQLNTPQQQAVEHIGSPLLVLAGAGSGKTKVITEKIGWLIRHRAVDPSDIAAVTFTNKAAREMQQRIRLMFNDDDADGLSITTFHSLGMKILRHEATHCGLRHGFSIIDPRDVSTLLAELLKADAIGNREIVVQVSRRISDWKNLGLMPEDIASHIAKTNPNPINQIAAAAYPDYQRYLRACNSVDLDDLILQPVALFDRDEEVKRRWQLQIRYLLVDEYQDTNGIQYRMVKHLADNGRRLTVVGDDDQSIYAWRGAQPQNLVQLGKDFEDLKVVKLEQNYRSCGRILKVANQLISVNPRPFEKNLWSDLGYGVPIKVFSADNEQQEAERVVSAIMRHQFQQKSQHGDFAILYRGNHQAKEFEVKLREMRIPYRISGGSSFFDRSEIRDIMAYLRLLTNPADDSALLRIINTPRRGVGATSLEKLATFAGKKGLSIFHALKSPELSVFLKTRQLTVLHQFAETIEELTQMIENGNAVAAVEKLVESIHYRRWLHDTCESDVAERRMDNVKTLLQWLSNAGLGTTAEKTLGALVSELVLNDLMDQQQEEENTNLVNLMTLHAAKGLEFPHVFIVGVEEDILPHRVSLEEGNDEEERRLFYVGLTRAMQSLTLSYASKRKRFGDMVHCEPSRFLNQLPAEELEWETGQAKDPEQVQQTGRAHLASIRALRANRK